MTPEKLNKLLEKLREKLRADSVPDDITGQIILNVQSGGLSGKVTIKQDL